MGQWLPQHRPGDDAAPVPRGRDPRLPGGGRRGLPGGRPPLEAAAAQL